ncbi:MULTISPECIES: glycosyltransferase [Dyella]|uniref:Glycosyltransferase n=2 Tax=Dyella TaxID=231454 RepID=A0A4R0YLH1_9GAMM|nr:MULTISPECIES: glycosyltransferase [Dyella]TBR36178.1 glycosyltransferase [Dyella terrae]TCI06227.1 glycosyltransferase [Dyella soli]
MNITHVVENLNRGGLERMVLELVKLQHRQGHHCQVVCLYDLGAQAPELTALGIPVIACGKGRGLDLGALHRLRRAIRMHGTDVLHTHNAVAHYHAALASLGAGVPTLINTRHGMGSNPRPGRREWLYRRALHRTRAVVTVCEAARRDGIERGIVPQAKARVVPNGICVERFFPASDEMRHHLLSVLGLPPQRRLIGTVGRLNWAKDQRGLIEAFAHVHKQYADAALVLIGDGELRAELETCAREAGVADSVHFLGDRTDVHDLLQGLDLFVLSSVSEGYSIALLEACAVALPIVATDVGGNAEIVHDGATGLIVPPRNPPALADAMLSMLRELRQATTWGLAARAWVEQHGSLEAMAGRYAALYAGAEE